MPVYHPPQKTPPNHFRLVVGRNAYITQSSSTNNAILHQLEPENSLWIHPKAARQSGIQHGDRVEVTSSVGKGVLPARVTDEIREDTVYMDSGFGALSRGLSNVYGKGASNSEIIEDYADEVTGNMAMHETFVTVKKISAVRS